MCYVIYVGAGKESDAEACIRNQVPRDLYGSCFHPKREMRKKLRGIWIDYVERLIPGYVFVTSDKIQDFYASIRRIPAFLKLLGIDDFACAALTGDELDWLKKLIGDFEEDLALLDRTAGLSQIGFDENDRAVVLSGPLKDMEGRIVKLDLHRRTAEVEVEMMGRSVSLYLGFEILQKTEALKEVI